MSDSQNAREGVRATLSGFSGQRLRPALAVNRGSQTDSFAARLLQQGLLANFGRIALKTELLEPLLDKASVAAAKGLRAAHASVLEHAPGDVSFKVRACGGVAASRKGLGVAEMRTAAMHALQTRGASIWAQPLRADRAKSVRIWNEPRSGVCVAICADQASPFGVLEVSSADDRTFDEDDGAFLQALADMLAAAIGAHGRRQASERQLYARINELQAADAALLAKDVLVQEANHRIANSLQLLRSLLRVQAKNIADPEVRDQIEGASRRIAAIGMLHRRLCDTGAGLDADARDYLQNMLAEMQAILPHGGDRPLSLHMDPFMLPAGDLAALGLITGELVTNAIKYGHGSITVQVRRQTTGLEISVSDDGGGFPPDFDPMTSSGLGMRLIIALAKNSGGGVASVDRSVSYGRIVVRTGFGAA